MYHSYLLRLWSANGGVPPWRVMVEHIGTHERYGFADLEGFFDFLRRQTGEAPQLAEEEGGQRMERI